MRELVEKNQHVIMVPANFKFANKGTITEVKPDGFTLELEYEPDGVLKNTYCEFYIETSNGTLYFDSFPKDIQGKTIFVASPAKHKFLQRRQFTRVKYVHDLELKNGDNSYKISTLDISAGGMKFNTDNKIDIDGNYAVTIPLTDTKSLDCTFSPIRIEKAENGGYSVSGQFIYKSSYDKMVLTQFCAKRNVELKNK